MTAQTDTLTRGVEYHRVLAGDERRIGRGILAIVLLRSVQHAMSARDEVSSARVPC